MHLDDYITGTFDSDNPANKEELPPLSELEQLQEDYSDLRKKLDKAKKIIIEFQEYPNYTLIELKKLFKL